MVWVQHFGQEREITRAGLDLEDRELLVLLLQQVGDCIFFIHN
jgi:hypothetical protein